MASKTRLSYQLPVLPVTVFAHLIVIAVTILVFVWLLHFREGLAFQSNIKAKIFNVHPFLMVIGFVLVVGEAIMAYKTVPAKKEVQKLFHVTLHFIALICGILGIYAVFKFHHELGILDMYTLHSWLGMSTICLFALQFLFAAFSFLYPGTESSTKTKLAPWHVLFGIIIFFMAILTAETGLVEKFLIQGLGRNQEALIVNFTGLLILLFGISVGLTVLLT